MTGDLPRRWDYLDFEVVVEHGRDGSYPVTVIRSPAGELVQGARLSLPFDSAALAAFLDNFPYLLMRSNRVMRSAASPDEDRMRRFGRGLFEALFNSEVLALYRSSLVEAEHRGAGLRLKLRVRPPELAHLPWEYLFDPHLNDYVCLSLRTPLVRYLEVDRPVRPLAVTPPLRLLAMAASPERMFRIDAAAERRLLADALQPLTERGLLELTWCAGQTWRDLDDAMRAGPWHVFHFVGHGSFDAQSREGAVYLAGEGGEPQRLAATDLARLIVEHPSLRFVVLNACLGARGDVRDVFSSTAATLVRRGVPAVLAMQAPFSDASALTFTRTFYESLVNWLPVEAAVAEARKVLYLSSGSLEWGAPVLYLRTHDGMLFEPVAPAPQATRHNLPPRAEFIGREAEKAQAHAALRIRPNLVCIEGIRGIGKTSLALEVAYECLRTSSVPQPAAGAATFDAVAWISAADRALTLEAVLDTLAEVLGYRELARLPLPDKRLAIGNLLQAQPCLLVVDDFEVDGDEDALCFLLQLPEPSRALITTHEQKLIVARTLSLQGLSEDESLALIRAEAKRLGLPAIARVDGRELLPLARATGGAPLALKWAIGQIKQKGQALDAVLRAVRDARGDVFDSMFARSWSLLSEDARRLLSVMPLFATSASRAALEAASDLHAAALDDALAQLAEMSLLDATLELDADRIRYSVHPLTHAFASARLDEDQEAAHSAHVRLAQYFQSFTAQHGGFWNQFGFQRIEVELPNVLFVVKWLWSRSLHAAANAIFVHLVDFLIVRGYWNELVTLGRRAIESAAQTGDELTAAQARTRALAWVHRHRGELAEAERELRAALPVFERLGVEHELYRAKRNLGRVAEQQGDFDQAELLLKEALAYFRSVGDARHVYLTAANLAKVALERSDLDTAWMLCIQVIDAARRADDPERVASLLKVMGSIAERQGDRALARSLWREGLTHSQRANRMDEIADAQIRLAHIERAMGEGASAQQLLLSALATYRHLNMSSRVREIENALRV